MRTQYLVAIAILGLTLWGCSNSSSEISEFNSSDGDCSDWSEQVFVTEVPDFRILAPRVDESAADIQKVVEVFGIRVLALEGVTDRDLLLVANVLAQWIDNDEDGFPDNKKVQSELARQNSRMILGVDFDASIAPWHMTKQQFLDNEHAPTYGLDVTTINHSRFGLEPSDYTSEWQRFEPNRAPDATTEETLHLITDVGFAGVYPAAFWPGLDAGEAPEFASNAYKCHVESRKSQGLENGSRLTTAMDVARGGFFASIPNQYPDSAWYTRYDECEYACLVSEYVHWAAITRAGMMEGRVTGVPRTRETNGDEWGIETLEELMQVDKNVFELLNEPEFAFPSVAPDGTYRN